VPRTTVYGHLDPVTKGKRPAVPARQPGPTSASTEPTATA
jgi:hypothetical protein